MNKGTPQSNLTNNGQPHVCGTIQPHNTSRSDRVTLCAACHMPVDPQSDPVSDFFNAPDEVKRPVYERALEKAQEEQSNTDWREEFDSMFDWADQIKEQELTRWEIMYGFTPNDIKDFISQLLEAEEKRWREEVEKQIRALPSFTDCDNHLDRDEVLQKLS